MFDTYNQGRNIWFVIRAFHFLVFPSLRQDLYIPREKLYFCGNLFRRSYWPFIDPVKFANITLNEYRHFYASLLDADNYQDKDFNIIDKVAFCLSVNNRKAISQISKSARTIQNVQRSISESVLLGCGFSNDSSSYGTYSEKLLIQYHIPGDCLQVNDLSIRLDLNVKNILNSST